MLPFWHSNSKFFLSWSGSGGAKSDSGIFKVGSIAYVPLMLAFFLCITRKLVRESGGNRDVVGDEEDDADGGDGRLEYDGRSSEAA